MPENKIPKLTFISMNRAQAAALADGFLDDIGTDDKDTLQLKETFTELFVLAGEFIEDAQENLIKSKNIGSGKLSESLKANEPTESNGTVSIDVLMNFYGKFQNKGVKGTRSGAGAYSFKTELPSINMVKAIQKWITRAKVSTQTVRKYKGYGSHEIKNRTISQYDYAFGKARSIKMYGIKPTGFIDKAVATTRSKVAARLGAALRIDILNSI